jgi:GAF domain-containing protein
MTESIKISFKAQQETDPAFIRLTRNILLFTLFATLLPIAAVLAKPSASAAVTITVLIIASILEIGALILVLRGKTGLARTIVPISLIVAVTIIAFGAHSIHDISVVAFPLIIIIATLLQGKSAAVFTLPFAILAVILLGTLDMLGVTTSIVAPRTGFDDILIGIILLIASSGILNLLISRLYQAIETTRANEQAQIAANIELKELQVTLEQRVNERTTDLEEANRRNEQRAQQFEAITLVGNAISSVRSLDDLLPKITDLISKQFGYYHVGIFLNDANNIYAILSAANSEGGKSMIQRGHQLKIGMQGIVGFAISSGQPHIALDVGKDAVFFGNVELPDTRSEIALPLRIGDQVVGALDVQSTEATAFSEEDTSVLSLLADQVSMAIENARLFDQSRKSLAESEALYRQYLRQAWSRLPKEQNLAGFRYNARGAAPIERQESANIANNVVSGSKEDHRNSSLTVPLAIRGQTIGTISVQIPNENNLNDDQKDLVKAVADRVALSAENARLFEETTRRAERERLVSDITVKIRSTNDPDTMIKIALEELKQALGATKVQLVPHSLQKSDSKLQTENSIPQSKGNQQNLDGKE